MLERMLRGEKEGLEEKEDVLSVEVNRLREGENKLVKER
jgi:hypothetical protein